MDIRHLSEEEVNVELEVRNIDPKQEDRFEKLKKILEEEAALTIGKPAMPHRIKANVELQACNRKTLILMGEFEKAKGSRDIGCLEVLFSRVTHVIGHFERLVRFAQNLNTPDSLVQAVALLEQIKSEIARSSSESPEFAGFSAMDLQDVPTGGQGAVPKKKKTRSDTSWPNNPTNNGATTVTRSPVNDLAGPTNDQPLPPQHSLISPAQFSFEPFPINNSRALPDPPLPRPNQEYHQPQREQGRNNVGLSHALARWSVRYGGGKRDLPIDEFFFRVENLAAADNIPANSLVMGLHCLLVDNAADFYWVQRRKNPDSTWVQLKNSMVAHFARQDNDFELRKFIMSKRQGGREEFGEFSLAIECLAARLTRPMDDAELLEILRQNMSPQLQDRLLMHNFISLDQLKSACQKYERMWARQNDHGKETRFSGRLAELGYNVAENETNHAISNSQHMNESVINNAGTESQDFEVAAINRRPAQRPNSDLLVCWNCDDIGHVFMDCQSPNRNIFCYGCGTKNVYKPKCPKCSPGNSHLGGNIAARSRPNPFAPRRVLSPNRHSTGN